ncbi:hypothetical protein PRK78_005717 [Emydomyces testavorans]|uniref:Transcription initiation factor TFIID subunit 8 n=1 Tax=Emydomyces testavorans TaxID=2070801 RepID=A0AAF0DM93_9EURO|nr:hypothetical protein PRK78_005717 [Emydomyces testavorans]
MASTAPSLKRPSPDSDNLPTVPAKKQKVEYRRLHRLQSPLNIASPDSGGITDDATVDQLLSTAIGSCLYEAGFDHAEPVALESFRDGVEEYMLRFLSYARASMTSCRRTQPIPQDFEHALNRNSVSLDSLRPYVKLSPKPKRIPNTLPTPPPEETSVRTHFHFLGPELSAPEDKQIHSYIPKHFPKFPSRHTYRDTPVYTKRETDTRKVREQATEEGRLAEEALRKLVHAAKNSRPTEEKAEKALWGREEESMDTMFEKAMAAVLKKQAEDKERKSKGKQKAVDTSGDGMDFSFTEPAKEKPLEKVDIELAKLDLGPVVNYERQYWRRRPVPEQQKDMSTKHGKA